jgi:hypothetical protein
MRMSLRVTRAGAALKDFLSTATAVTVPSYLYAYWIGCSWE